MEIRAPIARSRSSPAARQELVGPRLATPCGAVSTEPREPTQPRVVTSSRGAGGRGRSLRPKGCRERLRRPPGAAAKLAGPAPRLTPAERVGTSLRYFVLVATVGLAGRLLAWPLITSTVGPTAYVFAADPQSEGARLGNAVIGHGIAICVGLASLTVFGLLHHPSVSAIGAPSWSQIGAAALATGLTLVLLQLAGSHHAPAAATATAPLVSTGLAKPGPGLIGLVLGLAAVIATGPLMGRWPLARAAAARDQSPIPPPTGLS